MGSEATSIFIKDLHVSRISELEDYFKTISKHVNVVGNKRPSWEVEINKRIFFVMIDETYKVLPEIEDELLELNLLPEDVPKTIRINVGFRGYEPRTDLQRLADKIVDIFEGVQGPIYN